MKVIGASATFVNKTMAKRQAMEKLLDDLAAVRREPTRDGARDALLAGLSSAWNVAVGKAAEAIAEHRVAGFGEPLAAAFARLFGDPFKRDPQCVGMIAVTRAMLDTGTSRATLCLGGLRHRQFDGPPEHGRPTDSAGALRGYCGLGLLELGHEDAMTELTDLLADPTIPARVAAARGIGASGKEGAALVLRLKLVGPRDAPDVFAECMAGLLRLDPKRSVALVGRFLDDPDAGTRDVAALALGESRRPEALPLLAEHLRRTGDEDERALLITALATLRHPGAVDVLLDVLADGTPASASKAVDALATFRHDAAVRERVGRAVETRGDVALREAWARAAAR